MRDLGANWEMADAVAQFQPFLAYTRSRLPDIPLWNPYIEGGRPVQREHAVGDLLAVLVARLRAAVLVVAGADRGAEALGSAFGTFLLARRLGQSVGAALLAGVVAGFGLFHVVWLAWPLSSVWAWLPWVLLATDHVVRGPTGGGAFAGARAVVVALQYFGGHPETSFHVLAAALLFALLRGPRRVGWFLGGVAAGTALAAIVLIPFLELLAHSSDLANRAGREHAHTPLRFGLALALPDYWGRPTQLASEPFIVTRAFYAGALPLMLAAVALLRPTRERVAVAAAGAVALAVVLGVQPFFFVANHVPGFAQAHNTRLAIVTLLCLALLAGLGARHGGAPRPRARGRRRRAAGRRRAHTRRCVSQYEALKVAWGFATPRTWTSSRSPPCSSGSPLRRSALHFCGRDRAGSSPAAIALTMLDLARAGMGQNPAIPVAHAVTPRTGAMAAIGGERFVAVGGCQRRDHAADRQRRHALRAARRARLRLPDRQALRRSLAPRGDEARPARVHAAEHDREYVPGRAAGDGFAGSVPGDERSAAAVARGLRGAGCAGLRQSVRGAAGVRRRRRDGHRRSARRRHRARASSRGARRSCPRRWACGERLRARVVADEPERVVIRAGVNGRALLVLADTWFPGWRVRVDGRDASIVRTDQLLRGVVVGPGTHTVEFDYVPWSWRAGWIVSLLAAVGLLGLAWRRP